MRLMIGFAVVALMASPLAAAAREFEVDGVLEPPASGTVVVLSSADSPLLLRTTSNSKGGFRFRKVPPGAFTLWASVPGAGEALHSIEVGPNSVSPNGSVQVTLSMGIPGSAAAAGRSRYQVNLQDLSVPDSAWKEYNEAVKLLGANKPDRAVQRLNRAVSRAPQFWAAWDQLGVIAYHAHRYDEAEGFFRKAHELAPREFDPISNLGGVLLNLGRYQEALEFNTAAVTRRPADVLANSQVGLNYLLMNRLDRALRYLKEAKRLDPFHFTHPQRFLAEIYLRLSNRPAAAAELEDFITRHPDAPEVAAARRRLAALR